jgi:hypothetical protein
MNCCGRGFWIAMLLGVASLGWSVERGSAPPAAAADGEDPLSDVDGDLLPDALEWVVLSHPGSCDTDNDGDDDFLEVVQHRPPHRWDADRRGLDHEVRTLAFSTSTRFGQRIWVAVLFRFAHGRLAVDSLVPYVDAMGVRMPIFELVGGSGVALRTKQTTDQGLYALAVFGLATEGELACVGSALVGVTARIDGRLFRSGTFLIPQQKVAFAMMPVPRGMVMQECSTFVFQSLSPCDDGTRFFERNKICEMDLEVLGSGPQGTLCEVARADCEPANGLSCSSSGCVGMRNTMVLVPDGLGVITGR